MSTGNVFLFELRPLLFVMRLLGISPLQPHGNEVQFRFLSYHTMYFTTVTLMQLAPGVWYTYRGIFVALKSDGSFLILAFAYLLNILLSQMFPILLALQVYQQVNFITEWYKLQLIVQEISVTQKPLELGLKRRTRVFLIMIFLIIVSGVLWRPIMLGNMTSLDDLLHAIGMILTTTILFTWNATCISLHKISSHIIRNLTELQEYNETGTLTKHVECIVLKTRIAWLQLARLVMQVGGCMSILLVVSINIHYLVLLVLLYQLVLTGMHNTVVFLFVFFSSGSVITLVLVCSAAHAVNEKVTRNIIEAIQITKKLRIGEETKHTMVSFLVHMHHIFLPITFNSYIIVGRGLLTTIIAALLTNLVVIVQLNIRQKPINNVAEMMNFGELFLSE